MTGTLEHQPTDPGQVAALDWTGALRAIGLEREADEAALAAAVGEHRLRSFGWSDRLADPASGAFVVVHRAAVWDPTARPVDAVEAWSSNSPKAALAEALGRFLAEQAPRLPAQPASPVPPRSGTERLLGSLVARRRERPWPDPPPPTDGSGAELSP
jgi:hypothetical protein